MRTHMLVLCLFTTALLAACGGDRTEPAPAATTPEPVVEGTSVDQFMARLAQHCGQAFEGRIITNEPPQPNDAFEGQRLVMHVRECHEGELKVPFHVGDNHSRTWVLTRTDTGLRLKHDHRHEDGTDDAVTMYGGDTATPGTEVRQEFPVDQDSIEMFKREGLTASLENTWAMEIEPGRRFLYELSRPTGRLFQVEFDLTTPVDTPPVPWGHE
jgi:hypothetical protein